MKKNSGVVAQHRVICAALCVSLSALGGVGEAQQNKFFRIGYLSSRDLANDSSRSEAIRLALHDLGYVEGRNVAFESRNANGKSERALEPANWYAAKSMSLSSQAGTWWCKLPKMRRKQFPL